MSGIPVILGAAEARRARVLVLTPAALIGLPVTYQPASDAFFAMVDDDPDADRDASQGPAAFQDAALAALLDGAVCVVASAVVEAEHGVFAGALVTLNPKARGVLVLTQPQHHEAWAAKVLELSGRAPAMHVVVDGHKFDGMKFDAAARGPLH